MSEFDQNGKLEDTISLRCKYCGAPLDIKDEKKEFIRCNSCGTTQKMIDARAFLEQIMGQVYSWVRTAIPTGFDLSNAENVDPIARHNIFVNNIKPILETEYGEYKFNSMNLFANPLLVPPFKADASIKPLNDVSDVFGFNAKIKSIAPLAIDEGGKNLVAEVSGISTTYAYILNNLKLISEEKQERFELMAGNFLEGAKILETIEKFAPLRQRLLGLSNASLATKYLLDGNINSAKSYISQSMENLDLAKKDVASNFDLATMFQAVEKEISIVKVVSYMITSAERDPSGDPLNTVSLIENVIKILVQQEEYDQGEWSGYFRDVFRYEEIMKWIMNIRNAQYGEPAIKLVGGGGNILFPFWAVDLPYSFKTGVLWTKKGVEVTETVLVSATFTSDQTSLFHDPSRAITDVFSAREKKGFYEGVKTSVTGRETSISGGGGPIKGVVDSATLSSAGGRKIIPPLSSRKEADHLVGLYIHRTLETDRTIGKKLRLSAPRVVGLIFIPGDMSGSTFKLNINIENLYPLSVGDLSILSKVIM